MKNVENKFIINIGRQVGAGGMEIGKKLAELFNIDFYDNSLIQMAAKEAGMDSSYFENADESPADKLMLALSNDPMSLTSEPVFGRDELYKMQSDVIRKIASITSCVIVGRTSDYVLRDFSNCFNIFIYAPLEKRMDYIMKTKHISERSAHYLIHKVDKKRELFYNHYTNKKWGDPKSYHVCIDSSILGFDETAQVLKEFIERKLIILNK
jgi:cytidylate kinase